MSENPCVDDEKLGVAPCLSIEVDLRGTGAGAGAPADAACGVAPPGLANTGRCVCFACTSTSRRMFDSWIPCDTQSTSVAGCSGTLTDELNVARTSTMVASGPRGRTRKLYTDDESGSGSAV